MSDDCERSFSSGRDLIHYKRSRLLCDVIEACTCLRDWYGKPSARKVGTVKVNEGGKEVVIEQVYEAFDGEEQVQDAYSNEERM